MKECEMKDLIVKRCGLTIDPIFDELACSPDGFVYMNDETDIKTLKCIEIKCPFSTKDFTKE